MNTSANYLTLNRSSLKPGEEWSHELSGLYFIFPRKGRAAGLVRQSLQPLQSGDVFVIHRNRGGSILVAQGTEFTFSWFCSSFDHLFPLFTASELSELDALAERLTFGKIIPTLSPIAREAHRLLADVSPQPNLSQRGQLLRIAAAILDADFSALQRGGQDQNPSEKHLLKLFKKLSADQLLKLPVSELAQRFGCSRRHLNRLFRQRFGCSVLTFKMEMRLLRAVSLLRNPQAKVINIAAECGFNHLGLFNTCFRKRFGHSPTEWRRSQGKPVTPAQHSEIDELLLSRLSHLRRPSPEAMVPNRQLEATSFTSELEGSLRRSDSEARPVRAVFKQGTPNRLTLEVHSAP